MGSEQHDLRTCIDNVAARNTPKDDSELLWCKQLISIQRDKVTGGTFDLSRIPAAVCSCTGVPRQCYRWGAGGWQSVCCTGSLSEYPLPASTKRRGARITGRKMSRGAFEKVLETLAREGYNVLSKPINLKPYWAKQGTNKYVIIR